MSASDEDAERIVKNSWTPEEDALLREQIEKHGGPGNWTAIAEAFMGRSSKSCRLRWCNQLNPTVKRGPFTDEEDKKILAAHAVYGNKWAVISRSIPGRTDNQVKNRFNSTLRRVLAARARELPPNKRRRVGGVPGFFAQPHSPNRSGKSGNSSLTGVNDGVSSENSDEDGAIVGLEQLVAASLQVEKRESCGEGVDKTSDDNAATKLRGNSFAHTNALLQERSDEQSVRGAQMFADHTALIANIHLQQKLQQQIAQLTAAAYPAFHQAAGAQSKSTAGNAGTSSMGASTVSSSGAADPVQTLFAQTSVLHALNQHITAENNARQAAAWGFPTGAFGGSDGLAVAILAVGQQGGLNGQR